MKFIVEFKRALEASGNLFLIFHFKTQPDSVPPSAMTEHRRHTLQLDFSFVSSNRCQKSSLFVNIFSQF
jgi:hypothetical protein